MRLTIASFTAPILLLMIVGGSEAQRRPAPKPKPSSTPTSSPAQVTTKSAIADDGRAVILKSDGTWEYDPNPKPKSTPPGKTGSLDLEAGLIFNSGDVKPVGRATFYLLKEDPNKIVLTQEHLDAYNQDMASFSSATETLNKWTMYGAVLYMDGHLAPSFAVGVKKSLDAAAVSQTSTGFDGKATFANVPVGNYFLFGYYTFGEQTTYWNIPVSISAGTNKLVLDNNNMRG